MQLKEAAKYGDIFVTATGDINAINLEHIKKMKNGAILANAGHFDVEISKKSLAEISVKVRKIKENVDEYQLKDGRRIYLLAEGRLVNLACAEGHPPEVMDLSFSLQALSTEYLNRKAEKLKPQVYMVPEEIDQKVAQIKLKSMGIKQDKLTSEQKNYLSSYSGGT
jgi:adenosylhomocysteinase